MQQQQQQYAQYPPPPTGAQSWELQAGAMRGQESRRSSRGGAEASGTFRGRELETGGAPWGAEQNAPNPARDYDGSFRGKAAQEVSFRGKAAQDGSFRGRARPVGAAGSEGTHPAASFGMGRAWALQNASTAGGFKERLKIFISFSQCLDTSVCLTNISKLSCTTRLRQIRLRLCHRGMLASARGNKTNRHAIRMAPFEEMRRLAVLFVQW